MALKKYQKKSILYPLVFFLQTQKVFPFLIDYFDSAFEVLARCLLILGSFLLNQNSTTPFAVILNPYTVRSNVQCAWHCVNEFLATRTHTFGCLACRFWRPHLPFMKRFTWPPSQSEEGLVSTRPIAPMLTGHCMRFLYIYFPKWFSY